jgi:hypothetical protein
MNLLRKPVPAKLLKGFLFVVLGLVVIGFFFPSEEVLFWHMTSSDKSWSCQSFSVTAARSWIADAGSNCAMGIHLVRPRPTLISSLEERGSVTFLEEKQIADESFNARFERAFRIVSGTPYDEALNYTNNYQDSLGRCAIASKTNPNLIILWCQDTQTRLVTRYSGEKALLPEILSMLHQR